MNSLSRQLKNKTTKNHTLQYSVGSGLDDLDCPGQSGYFFARSSRFHPQKNSPDRSSEIDSIASSRATDLHQQVAWLNVASEVSSISIYLF